MIAHKVLKVPATFFAIRFINYDLYLSGDTTQEIEKVNEPWSNSVQVLQNRYPSSSNRFSTDRNVIFKALRSIAPEEELLVSYRNKEAFYGMGRL